jgi:hypothetical protein
MQGARRCPDAAEGPGLPPTVVDGREYERCPVAAVDRREAFGAFSLFRHYKAGFLPGAGGVLDQAEIALEQIEVLAAVVAEIEAEKAEKASHGR